MSVESNQWRIGTHILVKSSPPECVFLIRALKYLMICSVILMTVATAFAQEYLSVINQAGEVWARTLSLSNNSVGAGFKLEGPNLFGGPDDQFVLGTSNNISVVTRSGVIWNHFIRTPTTIDGGVQDVGSLFGGPDAKFVLGGYDLFWVINTAGEVWAHGVSYDGSVANGIKLKGPSLFGAPDYKYVLYDVGGRILVINNGGEVWAHDVLCSNPPGCAIGEESVGDGHKLSGPGLFGEANDKYVVLAQNSSYILVINTAGEVWAHNLSSSTIGSGIKLNGPGLFGAPNDKYVVVYRYQPPQ